MRLNDLSVLEHVLDLTNPRLNVNQFFLDVFVLAVVGDITFGAKLLDSRQLLGPLHFAQQVALTLELALSVRSQLNSTLNCHDGLTLRILALRGIRRMRQAATYVAA